MINLNINLNSKTPLYIGGGIGISFICYGVYHALKNLSDKVTPEGANNILEHSAEKSPEICKSFLPLICQDDENV